jgi:hypothetical protein
MFVAAFAIGFHTVVERFEVQFRDFVVALEPLLLVSYAFWC